jgi:hypothetical protein
MKNLGANHGTPGWRDDAAHKWTIDSDKFVIIVVDSSESPPLHAKPMLK